jgi:acetyltransferase-like isoleucine patch superfamily enzyme
MRSRRRWPVALLSDSPKYSSYEVGEWSYGEPEVVYYDSGAQLRVGRYCSFAPGVTILLGGEHHAEWVTTYPFSLVFPEAKALPGYPHTKGDVTVGNDVWIGQDALILSGVTIGDGAVVGARSTVTRDVEPYMICAGSPALAIRPRFPPQTIAALRRLAWWNWPLDKVKEAWPLLCSSDVEAFLQKYGGGTR